MYEVVNFLLISWKVEERGWNKQGKKPMNIVEMSENNNG